MKFHRDGTLPQNGEIWVFGSNLAGIHGAGAARVAREQFGAPMGAGMGLMGKSYAIPTKDKHIETLEIDEISFHIDYFIEFTHLYPDMKFFVTRVGCGLAGFTDSQIAYMFSQANDNCSFAEEWREYLE
jgi:hypothetical protein